MTVSQHWTATRPPHDAPPSSSDERASGAVLRAPDVRLERITRALTSDALTIAFQPVVDLRRGTVAGAEALARFALEPRRTPDIWFNEAWDVGLGIELELAAIRRALRSLPELPEGSHLALNASPQTGATVSSSR